MTEPNVPAVRGPLDVTVVPPVACMECGGALQWRCPTCRIAQSAAVADYVPPQDTAHSEMLRLLLREADAMLGMLSNAPPVVSLRASIDAALRA
jgi:hypothetical protein